MSKQRWYVWIKFRNEQRLSRLQGAFLSDVTPTKELFPQWDGAIGPFKTKRAALWVANNPYFHGTVADAEYWAKEQA